jgi:hypothetical protein
VSQATISVEVRSKDDTENLKCILRQEIRFEANSSLSSEGICVYFLIHIISNCEIVCICSTKEETGLHKRFLSDNLKRGYHLGNWI